MREKTRIRDREIDRETDRETDRQLKYTEREHNKNLTVLDKFGICSQGLGFIAEHQARGAVHL